MTSPKYVYVSTPLGLRSSYRSFRNVAHVTDAVLLVARIEYVGVGDDEREVRVRGNQIECRLCGPVCSVVYEVLLERLKYKESQ